MTDHFVQFYEDDAYLVKQIASFVHTGLRAGDAVVVIATGPHLEDLNNDWIARAAMQSAYPGQYTALDAADTLSKILIDGQLDEASVTTIIGPIFRRAADSGNGRVRVFGEMVALLSENGQHEGAIRMEALWNNFARVHPMSIFCAYPMRAFSALTDGAPFLAICNEHSRVGPTESYSPPANAHEHFRAIATLQQQVSALKAELARRDPPKTV